MQLHSKITGMPELKKSLDNMTKNMRGRIARKTVKAGAEPVQKAIEAKAPVGPAKKNRLWGPIKTAIKVQPAKRSRKFRGVRLQVIIANKDAGKGGAGALAHTGDTFYAAFVEFGHKVRARKKTRLQRYFTKDARGQVPPHPFVKPGWTASQETAKTAMVQTLKGEISKRDLIAAGGE